jgi:hypothetical protein
MTRFALVTLVIAAASVTGCAVAAPSPSMSHASVQAPSLPAASTRPGASADATTPVSPGPGGWRTLEDAPFARLEMAVAAHEGRIWLAGGLSPLGAALTDVDVFDPSTGTWSDGPSLPAALHHAALVSDGSRLVLVGGYLGSAFDRPTDRVFILEIPGPDATWTEGPPLPAPRAAGAAAWDGERIVYAGGVGTGVTTDVHALVGERWERIGSMARPREHLGAASDGEGRTWLLGGRVGSLSSNVGTVELVDGTSITLLESLPTARGGVAAFHDPTLGACLTGGESTSQAFRTVECIAADGSLVSLPELEEPHHGHGAAVVDGTAYVLLGGPQPALTADATVEAFDLPDPGR